MRDVNTRGNSPVDANVTRTVANSIRGVGVFAGNDFAEHLLAQKHGYFAEVSGYGPKRCFATIPLQVIFADQSKQIFAVLLDMADVQDRR
jgi:hypothetical protein